MPTIPSWALALTFWLHLLATVTLVGSLVATLVLILPTAKHTLQPIDQLAFIESIEKRLEPVIWFCLSLLIVTGLFQMSVNIHYDGFLSTSTQWSLSLLIKHGLVVIMIVVCAVQTWDVLPAIRRALMIRNKTSPEQLLKLQQRETWLLRANLAIAVLILLATAFARAS